MSHLSSAVPRSARRPRPLSRAVLRPHLKRALDVAGAALLLVLISPAFIVTCLLIRAGGGVAFLAERRVGRAGREFEYLKFRAPECGAGDGRSLGKPERRLTRLGRVLRWTAIDEIPQLLNVLRGDMSLVGPRPVTREELARSYTLFGGEEAYLSVRPGLIGPCEVCGRPDLGTGERVALTTAYVRHPSLRTDIVILLRSLGIVLRGDPGSC